MRKTLLGYMAGFLLMFSTADADEPFTRWEANQRLAYVTLDHACSVTRYRCDNIVVPQVRESTQLGRMGARGIYQGGMTLWIDANLTQPQRQLTIFHETVHYLQFEISGADFLIASKCLLEYEAFEMTNLYVDLMGYGDEYKRTLETWKRLYRC